MGILFSSTRRNQNHHHHHHHPPYYHHSPPPQPPPQPYYYHPTTVSDHPPLPLPLPLPAPPPPPQPQSNYIHLTPAYPTTQYQYQQRQITSVPSNCYYPNWGSNSNNNISNNYQQYPMNFGYNVPSSFNGGNISDYGGGNGWRPQMQQPIVPPPYVEHQSAKVVKNDVNVHKDTIKLVVDEGFADHFLVSFVFDAHFDGSITIYYFAKEEKETGTFTPAYPEAIRSVKVPFQKGAGQRFHQASGTGVDLGFFDLESLAKPSEDDVFPLVIFAEVCSSSLEEGECSAESSPRAQVTQAVIEKTNEGSFQVKAIRQILWIDGVRYELRDLYGIGNSSAETFNDDEPGKECVICMTEPKNTAIMPCRHLCMCSDCAQELRLQSNKCPICRQPITELIEIKINNASQ